MNGEFKEKRQGDLVASKDLERRVDAELKREPSLYDSKEQTP